jgi:RNA polymerase sigma factor (TIGR02999 family)
MPADHGDVTTVLEQVHAGDAAARDRLVRVIYDELRRMASELMQAERPDHTLQPTALVHEALLRLLGADAFDRVPNRRYLFAAAARAMREVLVDHCRRRRAGKRGMGSQRLPLDALLDHYEKQNLDVEALHEALDRLAGLHERQSQVVTLRFFGGFTVAEVAEQLGVSVGTVESDYRIARAWLHKELGGGLE